MGTEGSTKMTVFCLETSVEQHFEANLFTNYIPWDSLAIITGKVQKLDYKVLCIEKNIPVYITLIDKN